MHLSGNSRCWRPDGSNTSIALTPQDHQGMLLGGAAVLADYLVHYDNKGYNTYIPTKRRLPFLVAGKLVVPWL